MSDFYIDEYSDSYSSVIEKNASDDLNVSILDDGEKPDITLELTANDTLTVSIVEAQTSESTLAANDALTVSITEAQTSESTLAANDVLAVSLTDQTATLQAQFTSTDDLNVAVGEGQTGTNNAFITSDQLSMYLTEHSALFKTIVSGPPPDDVIDHIIGPVTRWTRRVEIYESDGTTPWAVLQTPDFIDGTISVDYQRSERRTLDLLLYDWDGSLAIYPDGFWYDKVIKVFRGVMTPTVAWDIQLGEFVIDAVRQPHFPETVHITARDYTKRMLNSKLPYPTSFPINHPIEEIVRTMALNSGIPPDKIDLPLTGLNTAGVYTVDAQTERWKVANDLCVSFGYELYFNQQGVLTMEPWTDPLTSPINWIFKTGRPDGNLVSFEKSINDNLLRNHWVVTGEAPDKTPVWGIARNDEISIPGNTSPTRVERIGERTDFYESAFVTSFVQAEELAQRKLAISSLEQFEVSFGSILIPWLDVGETIQFVDPNPAPGDPTRYLLSSMTLPLKLGPMQAIVRRVTLVG